MISAQDLRALADLVGYIGYDAIQSVADQLSADAETIRVQKERIAALEVDAARY